MKNASINKRIEYFDYLRIASTFAVIVIHVVILHWFHLDVNTLQWQAFTFFSSITRWSVPVFLMMSGALFVGGTQKISLILRKYVLRILTALFFWSAVYALVEHIVSGASLSETVFAFVLGHYHLWFLYVIAGLYLAVPLLRKIAESKELLRYFLLTALVCTCLIPQAAACVGLFSKTGEHLLSKLLGQFEYTIVTDCSFYFMLGYYLHTTEISPVWRKRIYILGVCGLAATCGLTAAVSVWKQEAVDCFLGYNTGNVLCTSAAAFVFAKYHLSYAHVKEKGKRLLQTLSKCSFGVYLVHILVLDAVVKLCRLNTVPENPMIFIPALSLAVFILSLAVSWLLHQIPVLKKYIV